MRQQGNNVAQIQFREILLAARNGLWTMAFWQYLISSRTLINLSPTEQESFRNVTRLYPTNLEVIEHNHHQLIAMGQPIVTLNARNLGHPIAGVLEKVSSDDAGELRQHLSIAIGARIMIRRNLWTENGIVNGSLGTLRGIVWPDSPLLGELPSFLLIEMDLYTGPPFLMSFPKVLPIPPTVSYFNYQGFSCSRKQFPITLAWAMTVHKSQGLTLDKVVIELGKREMVNGLTFVAISRVRQVVDLAFVTTVPFDRVNRIRDGQNMVERLMEEARLSELLSL